MGEYFGQLYVKLSDVPSHSQSMQNNTKQNMSCAKGTEPVPEGSATKSPEIQTKREEVVCVITKESGEHCTTPTGLVPKNYYQTFVPKASSPRTHLKWSHHLIRFASGSSVDCHAIVLHSSVLPCICCFPQATPLRRDIAASLNVAIEKCAIR